jgi:hypothetical protein
MRMDTITLLFLGVFALVVCNLVYRYFRHGSFTGAFLAGTIDRAVGEVALSRANMTSPAIKVYAMRSGDRGNSFVGIDLTAKAPLAASVQPFKLTRAQEQVLATLLEETSR